MNIVDGNTLKKQDHFLDQNQDFESFENTTNESRVFEAFLRGEIDVEADPPDLELIEKIDPVRCAHLGILPWREWQNVTVIFIDNLARSEEVRELLGMIRGEIVFLPMRRSILINKLPQVAGREMLRYARHSCPKAMSVRRMYIKFYRFWACTVVAGILVAAYFYRHEALVALILLSCIFVFSNSVLRLAAVIRFAKERKNHEAKIYCSLEDENLPVMTLFVPLHKEPEMLGHIFRSLSSLDYPSEKLDVKLILEVDDETTLSALSQMELPPYVEVIEVPVDYLRTKPKAMNYALPYAQGEILGIYDAEDRANPAQLREVAQAFHDASADTATVQCELTFYNSRQNWFTRCFTIEYRVWFSVVLPALQYFNMPVPLGGTSVFFRISHLRNVGAWDAHNVTEDADLGVRFRRLGFETIVIASKTREEANPRPISWVRQRSRWLKGYVLTWALHVSSPITLYRDLGLWGFVCTHVLFLGAFGNYLSVPILWMMWTLSSSHPLIGETTLSNGFRWTFVSIMIVSQIISLSIGLIALKNKEYRYLFWAWLTLPAYWIFGSAAAYKALFELVFMPFYWDKTQHGHGKEDKI